MSKLITELKDEHKALKGLLSEVYSYISTFEKKIEFVKKLKDIVVAHIEKEDAELYPFLNKEAEKDQNLKIKLDLFAKDWGGISEFANYYIGKYSEGDFDGSFADDTAKLLSALRQRMMKEEISLYSEYDRRYKKQEE